MAKITLEEFFSGGKTKVIECTTKEQSDAVRRAFHDFGKTWGSGASFLDTDYWGSGDTYVFYSNHCLYDRCKPDPSYVAYSVDDIVELASYLAPEPESEPDPNQLRVLLRNDYQWHDAKWDGKTKLLSIGKNRLNTTDIISVENDPRTKYLQCTKCNSIIKNTKKAISEHIQLKSNSKTCLMCPYLRSSNEDILKESWVKNDDGTYTRVKKTVCSLGCGNSWGHPSIDSNDARLACMYRRCDANTLVPIDDFFIKYPGAFDDMATVDALDKSKWQLYCKHYNDYIEFNWKGRYNISVYTTNLGIIDYIKCNYRNKTYYIVYSKKYDKMFAIDYGAYKELTANNSDFSIQYYNELRKIMKDIYKGEN